MKNMSHAVGSLLFAALLWSALVSVPSPLFAQIAIGISVRIAPPALPVYAQPICPGPGYIWTPGYWAWNDDDGYYWVPGTWVVAPVGLLWTPGYWGWGGGLYAWHPGYWGPHVGFYGGINYGFGYGGVGFAGGEWRRGSFFYNRSVTNVNVTNVTNVYNKTVIVNNTTVNNVSYNGGSGGVTARPTPRELAAEREPHQAVLATQTQHEQAASRNRQLFASENHGRPAVAATAKPGEFTGHSVVAAQAAGAPYRAPAMSPREARGPSTNVSRPGIAASASGNANVNNGFQKFGQTSNNPPANHVRPSNGNGNANANNGFQKFGQTSKSAPANHVHPSQANDSWRSNTSHPNSVPRPGGQPAASSPSSRPPRVENTAHAQSVPHSSAPPPQNARRTSAPQRPSSPPPKPPENHSRGAEHHPGEGSH
jgi:hypothetical protein